jgi:hypothetical protein
VPRRSYLTRIAEPRTPGLPTLFAAPRAAAEDARPPAILPVTGVTSPAHASDVTAPANRPAMDTLVRPPDDPIAVRPPREPESAEPFPPAPTPNPAAKSQPDAASAGIVRRATPATAAVIRAASKPAPPNVENGRRAENQKPDAVLAWLGPERPWDAPAPPKPEAAAEDPFMASQPPPPAESISFQPQTASGPAAPPPAAKTGQTDVEQNGPKIHIGHVEVRTAPPPPPAHPPAPVAPAAPRQALSRGYTWRSGPAEA